MSNKFIIGNRLRVLLLTAATLFLLSCGNNEALYSSANALNFHQWLDTDRPSPADLIAEAHDAGATVILLQDNAMRADTVDLAISLLPALYDSGIREWGIFFLNSNFMNSLNTFLSDRNLGESEAVKDAEKLLLNADASLGYREYRDFILYVRTFNSYLAPDEEPIKLLPLSTNRVFNPGILQSANADSDSSLLENPETTPENAAEENEYADDAEEMIGNQKPFQGILWVRAEDLPRLKSGAGITNPYVVAHYLPRHDIIGTESARRDIRDRSFAFETASLPFEGWEAAAPEKEADLVVVTPFAFRAVSPIEDFIDEASSPQAAQDFPDIRMKIPSAGAAARMNRLLKKRANDYRKAVEKTVGKD